jgi:iron complex outermembrane recepter protein
MSVRMTNRFRGGSAAFVAHRLLGASLFAALTAGPALAQNAASSTASAAAGDQLTEIVVTAQFRKENLQSTPIAITAITSQMIEDRSMTNVTDVAADVPSTTLLKSSTAFGPSVAAFIRGIGQYDHDPALEPGVGIYVDDVY